MAKRFLVGVADVRGYDATGALLFKSNTMLNTSIDISTSSTEISGGKRNKLENIYYHSGRLNITLEDTVWNMEWVKQNTGAYDIAWNTLTTETVTLTAAGGTVVGTPVAMNGASAIVGSIERKDGSFVTVQFNGKNFALPEGFAAGDKVCVEYYVVNLNASSIAIPASIIPNIIRVVMDCDLASNKAGEGVVGSAIFDIPALQLSGAQTINMTSDGYSTTPLSGMALAFDPGITGGDACSRNDVYAIITTKERDVNWYDDVIALAIEGGDFTMATGGETKTLNIIAVTPTGTKPAPANGLTVASATQATATISNATGAVVVTSGVSAEEGATSLLSVSITNKPSIEASCTVTIG